MGPKFVCKTHDVVRIILGAKNEAISPKFVCKLYAWAVIVTLGLGRPRIKERK